MDDTKLLDVSSLVLSLDVLPGRKKKGYLEEGLKVKSLTSRPANKQNKRRMTSQIPNKLDLDEFNLNASDVLSDVEPDGIITSRNTYLQKDCVGIDQVLKVAQS